MLYDGLQNEIDAGKNDLIELSKIEKKQTRFWDNILNIEENIYFNAKDKSSESINADLTKLYSRLRGNCEANNIIFEQVTSNNAFSGFGEPTQDAELNTALVFHLTTVFGLVFQKQKLNFSVYRVKLYLL